MSFVVAVFLLAVPQLPRGGDIVLPPRKPAAAASTTAPPLTTVESFRRDLADLQGPDQRVESKLQEMAAAYEPEQMKRLVLDVARSARANEFRGLCTVAARFCTRTPEVADEFLFQLLTRPLGDATRAALETMAALKGDGAKKALQECLRGRIAGVRRHAVELLAPMLTAADVPFALELSRETTLDLQMRGLDLLRALPTPETAARLVELLSKDPSLAGASCTALIGMGAPAVEALQRLLQGPRIDRGHAYAAFALAQLAAANGPAALPEALLANLTPLLRDPELLTRSLVAVAVADLLHRGAPSPAATDAACVEALLDVVQPQQFLPNLDLLRRPCEERLQRATGRLLGGAEQRSWRAWWQDEKATFVAVRSRLALDERAAATASVSWRQGERHVRLLGEGVADAAPMPGATEIVLTAAQMGSLLQELQQGGIFDAAAMQVDSALPRSRSLELRVPGGRAQTAMPPEAHPRFDALVTLVQQRLDEEAWQLFRDPRTEPERAPFWRTERAWREANPDPVARGRRVAHRVVAQWAELSETQRARAVDLLLSNPNRRELLVEADGLAVLDVLAQRPELGELDLRLLELAAAVPGDACWRRAIDVATTRQGGSRAAVRAVFAVLGPEAVLSALSDPKPVVRRAGIDEVMVVRDQRAAPRLVELLADADLDVARGAAMACGHLQVAAAARPLVDRIAAIDSDPAMRQECLRALGKVGGDLAFPVLQRALMAKGLDDREAALRGMGELRDPRAPHVLADLVVVGHGKDIGAMARVNLQRQPARRVVEAVLAQVDIVQDRGIKDDLVLLLGDYQDPAALPYLLDLMRSPRLGGDAAMRFSATTGVELVERADRVDIAERWYRQNRELPQWRWLLDALAATRNATSLTAEQFGPTAGLQPVPEMARLLVEANEPRLWSLCAAVLRSVTGEDFGVFALAASTDARTALANRCRALFDSTRAAQAGR
jgi:hypothetical protein